MAMTTISANGRSIGQNMSHLRSSAELDLVGCDQHSDVVQQRTPLLKPRKKGTFLEPISGRARRVCFGCKKVESADMSAGECLGICLGVSRLNVTRPLTSSQWLWDRMTSWTLDRSTPSSGALLSTISARPPESKRTRLPSISTRTEKRHSPTPTVSVNIVESRVISTARTGPGAHVGRAPMLEAAGFRLIDQEDRTSSVVFNASGRQRAMPHTGLMSRPRTGRMHSYGNNGMSKARNPPRGLASRKGGSAVASGVGRGKRRGVTLKRKPCYTGE
jgi:hypothetical protein